MRSLRVLLTLLLAGAPAFAEPGFGMFQVYSGMDEAAGYVGCADDLKEAADAGFSLVMHYPPERARYTGLAEWLTSHPDEATLRDAAALVFPDDPELAFQTWFWTSYLREVARQGGGKVKALVGPLWGHFVDAKSGVRAPQVQRFVQELCAFEKSQSVELIAGWYLDEEPLAERNQHDPAKAKPLVEAIRVGETAAAATPHRIWVGEAPSRPPKAVGAFLAVADALIVVQDPFLWSVDPAARVEEPQFERIPHSLRLAREIAKAVKNEKLEVHLALQAFDWADDDLVQPSRLDMHQQLRYAMGNGLADLGAYAGKPAWGDPPAGIWLFWWSDCKSERKGDKAYQLNRWDDPAGVMWKEACDSERSGEAGAVHVTRDETWSGALLLVGDVIVHKGATLTIQPGAMVRVAPVDHFQGGKDKKHVEIVVQGTLVVKGNEQMKIVFRCDTLDPKLNAKPRKPQKGDWYGFRLEAGGKIDRNKYLYLNDATKVD